MTRPLDRRLLAHAFFLALPTLAVVALVVFFWFDKVPDIVKGERDRVRAVYRETADGLRQQPGRSTPWHGMSPSSLKSAGKMAPGKWGFVEQRAAGVADVWYAEGETLVRAQVPLERTRDYEMMFALGGLFFLFVLTGMTVIGIRYFVRSSRERDDFLAATAHDLTTPLTALRLLVQPAGEEAKALVERLLLLVTNVKDFLRLGGRRAPQKTTFSLVAAYREAALLFAADYRDLLGADLPLSLGTGPEDQEKNCALTDDFVVFADETMTIQILWNLLGNDLKYAAPFGPVRAVIRREGGFVLFELIDEGPGMSAEQQRRCFDRYYRAKTVLTAGKGGFGIGLCTAKEFAEAMGGRLTVRANAPHGCIFTLSLPRGQ